MVVHPRCIREKRVRFPLGPFHSTCVWVALVTGRGLLLYTQDGIVQFYLRASLLFFLGCFGGEPTSPERVWPEFLFLSDSSSSKSEEEEEEDVSPELAPVRVV